MIGEQVSMGQTFTITVFSMGLVFLTLFVISLILDLFRVGNERDQRQAKKKLEQEEAKAAKEQPVVQQEVQQQAQDDGQLIAVITAAIAASLNTTTDKLRIKTIRQTEDPRWAQTGRIENMN
jgi:Na+-transporting methylmalonyl-CoA/oxaloacetate decarboxylase gamma subunit